MSRQSAERTELLTALMLEFRQLSTATVLFHQAIADRLGMNVTDHKCMEILCRTGPITAGELAEQSGLTTGAITGVVDRLEQAGFIRRGKDPNDRRRVVIEPILKRIERLIAPLFTSMGDAAAALCAQYTTEELAVIHDFTVKSRQMAHEETRKLKEGSRRIGSRPGNKP